MTINDRPLVIRTSALLIDPLKLQQSLGSINAAAGFVVFEQIVPYVFEMPACDCPPLLPIEWLSGQLSLATGKPRIAGDFW